MAGSSSDTESSTRRFAPTYIERILQGINLDVVKSQFDAIQNQLAFQKRAFDVLDPVLRQQLQEQELQAGLFTPEQQRQRALEEVQRQDERTAMQDELLQREIERVRQGGVATDEQRELINQSTEAQIRAGNSDILAFGKDALDMITGELAPSRGLRPSDTPIQDRAFKLGGELARQQGQLVTGLRGAQAQSELNYPLAANASNAALGQFQQQLGQSATDFQQQLRQQAFQNRLNLFGQTGQLGLGLSNVQPFANLQEAFKPQLATSGSSSSSSGGVSSKALKHHKQPLDEASVLAAMMEVPVETWEYIFPERDTQGRRIGPYAEDFSQAFGVGDGRTINYMDAIGVLMASVKALTRRVAQLEGSSE